jgi:hypothetical protein
MVNKTPIYKIFLKKQSTLKPNTIYFENSFLFSQLNHCLDF